MKIPVIDCNLILKSLPLERSGTPVGCGMRQKQLIPLISLLRGQLLF